MDKEDSIYTVLSLFGILALILSLFAMLNIRTDYLELTGLPNLNNYANKSDIPQSFPYSNLTGYPNTFPYNNLTDYPNTFPYNNLTGYPNTFPYNNLTGYPNTFPYNNLTGVPVVYNLTDGLILWLPLNDGIGNASDHSGFMNHGMITDASWVDGKYGKAINFNGVNNSIEVVKTASLDLRIPNNNFSVSLWFKTSNLSGIRNIFIWGNTTNAILMLRIQSSLQVRQWLSGSSFNTLTLLGSPLIDTWYNVVITYNGTTEYGFVNGQLMDTLVVSGSYTVDGYVHIGARNTATDQPYAGIIDDVRIYNRALSQAEITLLYNLP